ncbi:MAG: hypothetical protein IKO07_06075 [Clostridia bacterium]|nr:hypothetical protein [Clostridia bacterium]
MAKGRKRGCPVNIRNWLIEILDHANNEYVRIYGLTSMERSNDSDTEDGSNETDVYEEPFVTKRSGKLTLEGKPVVVESTGEVDPGQELLNDYATRSGCDGDATIRITDPYGHARLADYIVTSNEESSDADGDEVSWDLEQVGEAENLPYVHISSIDLKDGSTSLSGALSLTVGGAAKIVTVDFTPDTSSNKRFRVTNTKRSICSVGNITETGFTVTPIAAGTSTITVTTVEGAKVATLSVTVSAGA